MRAPNDRLFSWDFVRLPIAVSVILLNKLMKAGGIGVVFTDGSKFQRVAMICCATTTYSHASKLNQFVIRYEQEKARNAVDIAG
ncbi:hypothetical protein V6N11_018520 [Hibiscus sabdariffa]|uniref:Uncharacterized protein n=1 Tax=Hibiscus sabdariffa TaxID=183260 RepID=A0ABR2T8G9_9ROSI